MPTDAEKEPLLSKSGQARRIQFRQATQLTMAEITSQWTSVWVACLVSFLCGATFALFLMSIWPYLLSLDPEVSTTFYSVVVASFSLGRGWAVLGISAPLFGYVSNRIQNVRYPIIFGCSVLIVGNVLYGLAQLATGTGAGPWIILCARLLMGIGAGVVPLTIAYCATATVEADRGKAISLAMASNVFGTGLGPGLQLAFTPLGTGFRLFGNVRFDMYTAPAYVGVITMVLSILLMIFTFKEEYVSVKNTSKDVDDGVDRTPDGRILPPFDKVAIVVILLIWFVSSSVITTLESIASPYMMVMYNLNDQQAVIYSSGVMLACAMVTAVMFATYSYTKLHDLDTRYFVYTGMSVLIIYHFITYPWPFYTGHIVSTHETTSLLTNATQTVLVNGCDNKYPWCNDVPQVPLPILIVGYLLFFSTGMAETAAPLGVLYASVIGPRRQGTMQGIYAQVNSLARTIAPLIMLALFGSFGPRIAWIYETCLVLVVFVIALIFRKRLVPLQVPDVAKRTIMTNPDLLLNEPL